MRTSIRFLVLLVVLYLLSLAESSGETYYWIGGSGNWTDTLHWVSSTGSIPGPDDDVVFSSESFNSSGQQIVIDVDAYCRSMIWEQSITLQPLMSGSGSLHIYGGLALIPGMEVSMSGTIFFQAPSGIYEIDFAGHQIDAELFFSGQGEWSLNSPLNIGTETLHLNSGTLVLNGYPVSCGSFQSQVPGTAALKGTGSVLSVIRPDGVWQADPNLSLELLQSKLLLGIPGSENTFTFSGGAHDYDRVVFFNSAIIQGNNQFRILRLGPGAGYLFEESSTQIVLQHLYARGCQQPVSISSSGNSQAWIAGPSDLHVSFVSLKGIHVQMGSGATFTAYQSRDLGGNDGIFFQNIPRPMTWVGGTGNWSDTLHWSSEPAGPDNDCLPQPWEDVYFEDFSFSGMDTVHVDAPVTRVRSFIWNTSTPALFAGLPGQKLFVSGNYLINGPMEDLFTGRIIFNDSTGGRLLQTYNHPLQAELVFDGTGSWTLSDSLTTSAPIRFSRGAINASGRYVSCQVFHSDSANMQTLNIAEGKLVISATSPWPALALQLENLQFNSADLAIEFLSNSPTFRLQGADTIQVGRIAFTGEKGTAYLRQENGAYIKTDTLLFGGNGYISGSLQVGALSLSGGNIYSFGAGSTVTFTDTVLQSGSCTGPLMIKSTVNGSSTHFMSVIEDTLLFQHSSIRDVSVSGGHFRAVNSVDIGNNQGWDTIQSSAPGHLYWVGGAGNWSDPDHWSLTSGGPPGACIPTPADTVTFDQNSFNASGEKITVDQNNAFVHMMEWTGLTGSEEFCGNWSGAGLRVFGSMFLYDSLLFTFPGNIWFEANEPGQKIVTHDVKFHNVNNNVYFDGIEGSWELFGSLSLGWSDLDRNMLYLNNGALFLNGFDLDCWSFYSRTATARALQTGTTNFMIRNDWNINGNGFVTGASEATIVIDSGNFIQDYGYGQRYGKLFFNGASANQQLSVNSVDSVVMDSVRFAENGIIRGTNGYTIIGKLLFEKSGKVNMPGNLENATIFTIDTLLFRESGEVYGQDTVWSYLGFDTTGLISGDGVYRKAVFPADGSISGDNITDTLVFSPGFNYELGEADTLTVNEWRFSGNHCQPTHIFSSGNGSAFVKKPDGQVVGDFAELNLLSATGEADFIAGGFSININGSCTGWEFEDIEPYMLPDDTTFVSGESLVICSENFGSDSTAIYQWFKDDTSQPVGTEPCLDINEPGLYILQVTYDYPPGCVRSDSIRVGCFPEYSVESGNPLCHNSNDGWITLNTESGMPWGEIEWFHDGLLVSQDSSLNGLAGGEYIYRISDLAGCPDSGLVVLEAPDSITVSDEVYSSCSGLDNGMIALEVSGGTAPYHFFWNGAEGEAVADSLSPGTYLLQIADSQDCPVPDRLITIEELAPVGISLQAVDPVCFGMPLGALTIDSITGGAGAYHTPVWSFEPDNIDTTWQLSNIFAGTYHVMVTDTLGCPGEASATLSEPPELVVNATDSTSASGYGGAYVEITGGNPPYSVEWNTGDTTRVIGPVKGGYYYSLVTDQNNCTAIDSVWVDVHYHIHVPTAFSPNNDGLNDSLEWFGVGSDLKSFKISIYNRIGGLVSRPTILKSHGMEPLITPGSRQLSKITSGSPKLYMPTAPHLSLKEMYRC
ncbi:MAG: hypothetical protein Kow00127_03090 [Bacteroidales bacterium]